MSPPAPPEAVPVEIPTDPESPLVAEPVARVMPPLTPLVPASAELMLTAPLEVAEPSHGAQAGRAQAVAEGDAQEGQLAQLVEVGEAQVRQALPVYPELP